MLLLPPLNLIRLDEDLARLPELHAVDRLLHRADGERRRGDDLGPSEVRDDVEDGGVAGDLLDQCEELRVVGEGQNERVESDRAVPPICEVQGDEEELVPGAEEEERCL